MDDLNKLASEIRSINASNGWNIFMEKDADLNDYKVPAILALIHSEITEAVEALDCHQQEGIIEELADVEIRLLDYIGGYDSVDFNLAVQQFQAENHEQAIPSIEDELLNHHTIVSHMLEAYRKEGVPQIVYHAARLYTRNRMFAECFTDKFDDVIAAKLDKNRGRGWRHGGRRV